MIKTDGGVYYMTCGEGCYIARNSGGKLLREYFGKRVEPEDDIAALGGAENADETDGTVITAVGGKGANLAADLKIIDVHVEPKQASAVPSLRGGKTLCVGLVSADGGLKVDVYYTPYARGGIARRTVVKNTGVKSVEVKALGLFGIPEGMKLCAEKKDGAVAACGTFVSDDGDAPGLYPIFGGGCAEISEGRAVMNFADGAYKLEPGAALCSPEVLAVYSDSGRGGLMRAAHDIVRENLIPEKYLAARRPIALLNTLEVKPGDGAGLKALCDGAVAACGLGADTYIIDIRGLDITDKKTAALVAEVCKACEKAGIKSGVACTAKVGGSGFARAVKALYCSGVRHIECDGRSEAKTTAAKRYDALLHMYGDLAQIAEDCPELIIDIEGSGRSDLARLCFAPYIGAACAAASAERTSSDAIPPCAVASRIEPRLDAELPLKTRFDMASVGCLTYAADPLKLDEGIARAVRAQIFSYQDDSKLVLGGDLYGADVSGAGHGAFCAMLVSKDKSSAYAVYCNLGKPCARLKLRGLDEHNLYYVRETGKTFSGAALVGCGIDVSDVGAGDTATFHLRQVADYES